MITPSIDSLKKVFGENAEQAKEILTCQPYMLKADAVHPNAMHHVRRLLHLSGLVTAKPKDGELRLGSQYVGNSSAQITYLCLENPDAPTVIHYNGNYRVQTIKAFMEEVARKNRLFKCQKDRTELRK